MSDIESLSISSAVAETETPALSAWSGDAKPIAAETVERISLPVAALTYEQAVLSRRIGCGLITSIPQLGNDAVLTVGMPQNTPAEWLDPVIFSGSFGAIEVERGTRLIRALSGIDLSSEQVSQGIEHDWLHAAVLGRLHGTPFGGTGRIASTGNIPANPVVLRIVLHTEHHAISVHARGSASAWLDLLSRTQWERKKRRHPLLPLLPLPLPVILARHTLPAGELHRLNTGDVILPSASRFTCDAKGIVPLGGVAMHVQFCPPCNLEIIKMEDKLDDMYMDYIDGEEASAEHDDQEQDYDSDASHDEESEMNYSDEYGDDDSDGDEPEMDQADDGDNDAAYDDDIQANHVAQANAIDAAKDGSMSRAGQVPVTLDFTLGQVRLSLDELDTLALGSVLTIEGGSPAAVSIVSGGKVLGLGEAVSVNGKLGIRIVQWG